MSRRPPGPMRRHFIGLMIERRKALDLSQAAVAKQMGASHAYVNAVETGRCNPSLEFMFEWANALGFEMSVHIDDPTEGREFIFGE